MWRYVNCKTIRSVNYSGGCQIEILPAGDDALVSHSCLQDVVIPAFRKNRYADNNLNKYNENRVGDDNFSNLKVLTKGCK